MVVMNFFVTLATTPCQVNAVIGLATMKSELIPTATQAVGSITNTIGGKYYPGSIVVSPDSQIYLMNEYTGVTTLFYTSGRFIYYLI